ncbi:hypothetical protein TNCV_3690281 [Trichonephila clavipes]|uniref:Uncharacterized protein n=1 Tax=Trichonephila clavipes TaxID=2585209 RepID=A0A8X6VQX6_TRICX|nr:hypothetical protein TNCV_3690281 [Trichonephila clavipes]
MRRFSPKNSFPVRKLMTYQRSRSFVREVSKTGQSSAYVQKQVNLWPPSLYPADREVTGTVTPPFSGLKVHHTRSDKDQ